MKRRPLHAFAAMLILAVTLAWGQGGDNLLPNPGFESLSGEGAITQWTQPDYWSGELTPSADDARAGERSAALRAVERQDRHWGRIHSSTMPATVGLDYRFSVWAKGSGDLKLGVIHYRAEHPDLPRYETAWQEAGVALSADWQESALAFTPVDAHVQRVAVMIEVEGEGARALLDDAALEVEREAEGELQLAPAYLMVTPGSTAEIRVSATREDAPLGGGRVVAFHATEAEVQSEELALDDAGAAEYALPVGPEPGLSQGHFACPEIGEAQTAYVDVVSPDEHQAFMAAAQAAQLGGLPAHLLFLGDSLSDQKRGYNYTDQVGYWLREAHGNVSFRNAGVGGDYITRVWQRMNGEPSVYRPDAYDGLFEPKPTHVYIFLGHNDTKLTSNSDFENAVVSPEDYAAQFRLVIERIREAIGAPITLLSSTSSVYEITKPRAEELLAQRGAASLFGKPEVLERYNDILRQLAQELGCSYLDVYEPTRTHPDKPSLFTADGVHLSLEGNHLIALEILKHLAD